MSFLKSALLAASAFAVVFGSYLTTTTVSEAHERRAVGSYTFVVGWLSEPALINQPNAVDLRVSRTEDASPVTGLEQTLRVEVTSGEKSTEATMRPRFNVPGAYDGRLVPTELGSYVFQITGTIDGFQVNETFTGGPGTFSLIEEGNAFPNPLPIAQELEERIVVLESASVTSDGDSSDNGTMFGIAGIIVGALGLVVGGIALTKKN